MLISQDPTPSEMASAKASTKGRFFVDVVVVSGALPGMPATRETQYLQLPDPHHLCFSTLVRSPRFSFGHLVWQAIKCKLQWGMCF
jgi:hypothetical protein